MATLFFRTLTGSNYHVDDVDLNGSIETTKRRLAEQMLGDTEHELTLDEYLERFRLVFVGKTLNEWKSWKDYNIHKESTIEVIFRLLSCKCCPRLSFPMSLVVDASPGADLSVAHMRQIPGLPHEAVERIVPSRAEVLAILLDILCDSPE